MNELMNLEFEEQKVRTVVIDGEIWWVAKDVCNILGIKNSNSSIALLYAHQKRLHTVETAGGGQLMVTVSQSGVYALILKGRKPESDKLRGLVIKDISKQVNTIIKSGEKLPKNPIIDMLKKGIEFEKQNKGKNNMNELITISTSQFNDGEVQTVNARDLWEFLGSKRQYADWIKKRIKDYGFVEGVDYIRLHKKMKANNATLVEYHSTIDMAEELAMVERNEKGREIRKFFIKCKNELLKIRKIPEYVDDLDRQLPHNYESCLEALMITEKDRKRVIKQNKVIKRKHLIAKNEITELLPDAEYGRTIKESPGLLTITEIAKLPQVDVSGQRLNRWLKRRKVQFQTSSNRWVLYKKYQNKDYIDVVTHLVTDADGKVLYTKRYNKWTEKGVRLIITMWINFYNDLNVETIH